MKQDGTVYHDPQQSHDEYQLNNIYERNKSRDREIDATLAELSPLIDRLMRERRECLVICQRSSPSSVPTTANGSGVCGATAAIDSINQAKCQA